MITDKSYKLSFGLSIAVLLIIGIMFTALMDYDFNPKCGVDQCRYVDYTDAEDFYSKIGPGSSTWRVFKTYTVAQYSNNPYVVAFIVNLSILLAAIVICGKDFISKNLILTFVSPYLFLAGKEFFILFGVLFFFASMRTNNNLYKPSFVIISIAFVYFARPPFIMVFGFIFLLMFIENKMKTTDLNKTLVLYVVSIVVVTISHTLVIGGVYVESSSLHTESSIPFASELRVLTSGYGIVQSVMRSIVYIAFGVFSPVIEVIRLVKSDSFSPITIMSIVSFLMPVVFIKRFGVIKFIFALVITSSVISPLFSFVHTRYLVPIMYFVFLILSHREYSKDEHRNSIYCGSSSLCNSSGD